MECKLNKAKNTIIVNNKSTASFTWKMENQFSTS